MLSTTRLTEIYSPVGRTGPGLPLADRPESRIPREPQESQTQPPVLQEQEQENRVQARSFTDEILTLDRAQTLCMSVSDTIKQTGAAALGATMLNPATTRLIPSRYV